MAPIISAMPVPEHHGAVLRGADEDQSRNLAKPVTVDQRPVGR